MNRYLPIGAFGLALALLAGCTDGELAGVKNDWHPSGANAGNIAVMASRPQDMIQGRGDPSKGSAPSVLAIERIRLDQAKPLLTVPGTSSAYTGSTSSGGPGAPSGSGAGN